MRPASGELRPLQSQTLRLILSLPNPSVNHDPGRSIKKARIEGKWTYWFTCGKLGAGENYRSNPGSTNTSFVRKWARFFLPCGADNLLSARRSRKRVAPEVTSNLDRFLTHPTIGMLLEARASKTGVPKLELEEPAFFILRFTVTTFIHHCAQRA